MVSSTKRKTSKYLCPGKTEGASGGERLVGSVDGEQNMK